MLRTKPVQEKHKKFYMLFDKRFKNLILCSNLNSDSGVDLTHPLFFTPHSAGVLKTSKI